MRNVEIVFFSIMYLTAYMFITWLMQGGEIWIPPFKEIMVIFGITIVATEVTIMGAGVAGVFPFEETGDIISAAWKSMLITVAGSFYGIIWLTFYNNMFALPMWIFAIFVAPFLMILGWSIFTSIFTRVAD